MERLFIRHCEIDVEVDMLTELWGEGSVKAMEERMMK